MTSPTTIARKPGVLIFARHFPVNRELLFSTFSQVEHLRQWWGPPGFPVVECTIDFRPQGVWHYRLRGEDGVDVWARSVYQEIVPPERLSYLEHSSNAAGTITHERPGALVTITLKPQDGGTMLTATMRYASPVDGELAIRFGVERGFSRALDQLEQLLEIMEPSAPPNTDSPPSHYPPSP